MQLLPIRGDHDLSLTASAIRNVCNATLSLLFTIFLFIWGLLVNRCSAWRTDGGTAIFGACALGLALASTGLTCLYVHREEEYVWLPGLMWSVVLSRSWIASTTMDSSAERAQRIAPKLASYYVLFQTCADRRIVATEIYDEALKKWQDEPYRRSTAW
jgi:hypothetical protein